MRGLRTILVASALFAACVSSVSAQRPQPLPPNIKPGTVVDVNDWGKVKLGEFVEVTRQGWIKVRLENGEEKDFWAKDVRISKTKKLKSKTGKPAAGGGLAGMRTWSDASGKFTIEAQFVGLAGDKVELKKADGSAIAVPLDKLSTADQDIARSLAAAPAAGSADSENPFVSASPGGSSPEPEDAAADSAAAPVNMRRGDLSGAPRVALTAGEYQPPSIAAASAPKLTSKGIALPSKRVDPRNPHTLHQVMSESPGDYLFVDRWRNQLWAPIEPVATQRETAPVRIERLDLATGKAVDSLLFPPLKRITDIDSSGKLVVAIGMAEFGKSASHVDLYRLTGTKVARVMRFQPYGEPGHFHENEICLAAVVGTSHLLTCSYQGSVALWKLPDMSPVYTVDCGETLVVPALSPDGKVLAVSHSSGLYLLDALTGEVQGHLEAKLPSGRQVVGQLAFDAAGSRLALAGGDGAKVFDLKTGKLLSQTGAQIPFNFRNDLAPMGFAADPRYLLVGYSLVDLELGVVLCQYHLSGEEPHAVHGGRLWCLLTQRDATQVQRGLVHFEIPHPEAVAKADGVTRESMLAVKPGEKVGIQMSLPFSGDENQKIKDALVKAIEANGWVYSDEAPTATIACEVTSKSTEEVFESFRGSRQNVTLTDYFGKVQLKKGDKVAWETGTGWFAPRTVFAKEGEAAAEVAKHKPNWQYFTGVKPPKDALLYPDGGSLCTATISAAGVETR